MADSEKQTVRRSGRPFFLAHKRKALLTLLLAAAIVLGVALLLREFDERLQKKQEAAIAAEQPNSGESATLCAVGDITIDDTLLEAAKQADGSYDFTSSFLPVASLLSGADLTVGNLELTFSGEPYGGSAYSAPDSLAGTLSTLGFDLLQTANSRTMAGGLSGLERTIDTLRTNNLTPLGTYKTKSAHDAGTAVLREVNGIRIAFVAFTKGFDGMSIPSGSEYCTNLLYEDYDSAYTTIDEASIRAVMQDAADLNPDVTVAMVHWGSAYKLDLSDTQEEIADLLFETGADVILGSHSHMVGKMEQKTYTAADGSEREVFLAYSLGNFYASDDEVYTRESVVLNLTFTKDSETGETHITGADYVPIYIWDAGEDAAARYQVLNVHQAITLYEGAYIGRVDEETYTSLTDSLDTLKENTESDLDCGADAALQAASQTGTAATAQSGTDSAQTDTSADTADTADTAQAEQIGTDSAAESSGDGTSLPDS